MAVFIFFCVFIYYVTYKSVQLSNAWWISKTRNWRVHHLLRAPGSECLVRYLKQLPIPVRRPGNHTPHDCPCRCQPPNSRAGSRLRAAPPDYAPKTRAPPNQEIIIRNSARLGPKKVRSPPWSEIPLIPHRCMFIRGYAVFYSYFCSPRAQEGCPWGSILEGASSFVETNATHVELLRTR